MILFIIAAAGVFLHAVQFIYYPIDSDLDRMPRGQSLGFLMLYINIFLP